MPSRVAPSRRASTSCRVSVRTASVSRRTCSPASAGARVASVPSCPHPGPAIINRLSANPSAITVVGNLLLLGVFVITRGEQDGQHDRRDRIGGTIWVGARRRTAAARERRALPLAKDRRSIQRTRRRTQGKMVPLPIESLRPGRRVRSATERAHRELPRSHHGPAGLPRVSGADVRAACASTMRAAAAVTDETKERIRQIVTRETPGGFVRPMLATTLSL